MACQRSLSQCFIHIYLPSVFWVPIRELYLCYLIHSGSRSHTHTGNLLPGAKDRNQLPPKGFDSTLTSETCLLKLIVCNFLPSISNPFLPYGPSLSVLTFPVFPPLPGTENLCCPSSSWWLERGQHRLTWVSQWVTTNGWFFLWLILVLELSETFLRVAIGETEVLHVLNSWNLDLWS